jgi:hypothetical protein
MCMHRSLLFFLLLLGAACSMQQDIEVDLPAHTPITFVECYLEPGVPARVLATESVSFFEKLELAPADDLDIRLYRNGEEIPLVNKYLVDSSHNNVFNYISSDTVHYDQNSHWELVVHKQEKEIARGEARFLPKPEIDTISYTLGADSLIALEIKIRDNPDLENFYRVRIHAKDEFPGNGYNGLYTDEIAKGSILTIRTGLTLRTPNNGLVVTVYHLEESYYTYLRSLQKTFDANYNPFAQPANIESNLQGEAMGVFTAVSGVTKLVYVDR